MGAVGVLAIFSALWILAIVLFGRWTEAGGRRAKLPDISDVDEMSGGEFERFVGRLMEQRGWSVDQRGGSGDFGADLIAHAAADRIVVQAKRRKPSNAVGPGVIRKTVGAREYHDCTQAMVVTNSGFSRAATKTAEKTNVRLVDREELRRWVRSVEGSDRKETPAGTGTSGPTREP